jgi:hypothetical protein
MKQFDLTKEEQDLLASYRTALNNLQQQFIGAQQALCAVRKIRGSVDFTDTQIIVTEKDESKV